MSNQQEKLSDFVRRIIHEKGLSYRKVADKSGGLITHSTVSDVVNERVSNLASQSIAGLAKGLGVTEQEIFSLVRGKTLNNSVITNERFARIAEKYSTLTRSYQKDIDTIIDGLEVSIDQSIRMMDIDAFVGFYNPIGFIAFEIVTLNKIFKELEQSLPDGIKILVVNAENSLSELTDNDWVMLNIFARPDISRSFLAAWLYNNLKEEINGTKLYIHGIDIGIDEVQIRNALGSLSSQNQNIDGRELATKSKRKIPLDRGIEEKKRKVG